MALEFSSRKETVPNYRKFETTCAGRPFVVETGKLCGDVDFAAIEPKASVITPVPGGVGPMTICCLMENTIECFLRRQK